MKALLTVFLLFIAVQEATAQNEYLIEYYASIGASRYDVNNIGTSFNFGGGVGVRPFSTRIERLHALGFEVDVNHFSSQFLASRTTATGDALYHFTLNRTEPYVLFGMGGSTLGCYGMNGGCGPGWWVGTVGGGVRLFAGKHFVLRPDLRAYKGIFNGRLSGPGGFPNYFYRASVGIGYHF